MTILFYLCTYFFPHKPLHIDYSFLSFLRQLILVMQPEELNITKFMFNT